MGARCATDDNGCPPIHIRKVDRLEPIDYKLPMASAQIKSCVLLAGMYADGETTVTEPAPTRDHTERMLRAFDYQCLTDDLGDGVATISIQGGGELKATNIEVPADISSAAFFMVAASIVPDSSITLNHVGVNPTRTGVVKVLKAMGADIEFANPRLIGGEPVADIKIEHAKLQGIEVDPGFICIAAACAEGVTLISGAEELRHKESDRISAMVTGLRGIGIEVEEYKDGLRITGGPIQGGEVDSFQDHRIAMSFLIAGAVAADQVLVTDCENISTSFPNFVELARQVGLSIDD